MQLTASFQQIPFTNFQARFAHCRIADLIASASAISGYTVEEIKGANRHFDISRVRFAICYVAYRHLGKSYPQIGLALGRRDHTTALHAKRRAEQLIGRDPVITGLVDALTALVRSYDERRAA